MNVSNRVHSTMHEPDRNAEIIREAIKEASKIGFQQLDYKDSNSSDSATKINTVITIRL